MQSYLHFAVMLLFSIISSVTAFAQQVHRPAPPPDPLCFEEGTQILHLGFGIGAPFISGSTSFPPLQVHYEYGITEDVSVGGVAGYTSSSSSQTHFSYLIAAARANYHFGTSGQFDPYGGAALGYNKASVSGHYIGEHVGGVYLGAQLGANYYFSPKLGAWADVGYGIGYLNLGISFKF